jgi:hypothetical protein
MSCKQAKPPTGWFVSEFDGVAYKVETGMGLNQYLKSLYKLEDAARAKGDIQTLQRCRLALAQATARLGVAVNKEAAERARGPAGVANRPPIGEKTKLAKEQAAKLLDQNRNPRDIAGIVAKTLNCDPKTARRGLELARAERASATSLPADEISKTD